MTSYVKLNETVDQVFPPTKQLHPEFNDFKISLYKLCNVFI